MLGVEAGEEAFVESKGWVGMERVVEGVGREGGGVDGGGGAEGCGYFADEGVGWGRCGVVAGPDVALGSVGG